MSFPAFAPGAEVGDWRVDRPLGIGAAGIVYAAHNRHLPELKVALKVLTNPGNARSVARLRREAALLARLEHPNIVRVRSMQMWQGHPCLIMDMAVGCPLSELVRSPPIPPTQALSIVRQLAEALAYAHQQGVAHRDVKPSNVVLETSGLVRLLDFGIATHTDFTRMTAGGGLTPATPSYAAPEWFEGSEPDARAADAYALGVLAYELLLGQRAFVIRGPDALHALRQAKADQPYIDVGEGFSAEARTLVRDLTRRAAPERTGVSEAADRLSAFHDPLVGVATVMEQTRDSGPAGIEPPALGASDPTTFDRYVLVEERERSQNGITYRAHDPKLERDVTLKVLMGGRLATGEVLERFLNEARVGASLDHPHIVRVHEVSIHDEQLYFTSDFVEGPSLAAWLSERGRAEPRLAARWVAPLSRAVAFAHAAGIAHRNISLANVILADNEPRLTDFGLARRLAADAPGADAPQHAEERQDAAELMSADLRALGAVLFELCTGVDPVTAGASVAPASRMGVLWPRDVTTGIPPSLEAIVVRATDPRCSAPLKSALELAEQLETYLAGDPIDRRAVGSLAVTTRWARRRRTELLVVGGLVVGVGATAGAALGFRSYTEQNRAIEAERSETARVQTVSADGQQAVLDLLDSLTSDEALGLAHSLLAPTYIPKGRGPSYRRTVRKRRHHLASAWLVSPTPQRLDALVLSLAGESGFEQILPFVPVESVTPQQRWWSAFRAGNLEAAGRITELPRWAALARQFAGTRLGPDRAAWDVDGDGRAELSEQAARKGMLRFARARDTWATEAGLVTFDLPSLPPVQLRTLALPKAAVTADVDGDGAVEAYVGLGHYDRTLTGFLRDGEGWKPFVPNQAVNAAASDVTVVVPMDLDGNGDDELVVGLGLWTAFDLRVLDWASDGASMGQPPILNETQRLRFGQPLAAAVLRGSPNRLAVSRAPEHRVGEPTAGVIVYEGASGQLRPVSTLDRACSLLFSADADADGRDDLICTLPDHTVVWLSTGSGGFDAVELPGVVLTRATDLDGDGDIEFVGYDRHDGTARKVAWGFGQGTEAARELSPPPSPLSTDTGWARIQAVATFAPGAAADALVRTFEELGKERRSEALELALSWYVQADRPKDAAALLDTTDPRRQELLVAAIDLESLATTRTLGLQETGSVGFDASLSDAWTVHDPFAVRRDAAAGALVVEGAGFGHLLASLHLTPSKEWGGRAGLTLSYQVDSVEQGSSLVIRIRREDGSHQNILHMHHSMGRGIVSQCGLGPMVPSAGTLSVLLSATETRCRVGEVRATVAASSSPPIAVEIWANGRPTLGDVPLGRLRISDITLFNLQPQARLAGGDHRSRLVADGQAGAAVEALNALEHDALEAALYARALAEQHRLGDAAASLRQARALARPEQWLGWQRLAVRRAGPLNRAVRQALGDEYEAAMVDAWAPAMYTPSSAQLVELRLGQALLDLDQVRPTSDAQTAALGELFTWRAALAMRKGELEGARVDIQHALQLVGDDAALVTRLLIRLVEIEVKLDRREAAQEYAQQALRRSPSPRVTEDRISDIMASSN